MFKSVSIGEDENDEILEKVNVDFLVPKLYKTLWLSFTRAYPNWCLFFVIAKATK